MLFIQDATPKIIAPGLGGCSTRTTTSGHVGVIPTGPGVDCTRMNTEYKELVLVIQAPLALKRLNLNP